MNVCRFVLVVFHGALFICVFSSLLYQIAFVLAVMWLLGALPVAHHFVFIYLFIFRPIQVMWIWHAYLLGHKVVVLCFPWLYSLPRQFYLKFLRRRSLDHLCIEGVTFWIPSFMWGESLVRLLNGVWVYFMFLTPNEICKFNLWPKWPTRYSQSKSRFSTPRTISEFPLSFRSLAW